ncbi:hypothetical protein BWI17_03950 [Betaproteobacteria bacterium GR16-43]|nr:hypothetical protein BWI17_03950 [Betaproteobacteria bacterium GR16-43]
MPNSPYAPPKANLGAGHTAKEPGSALKAVLVAFVVKVMLSFALGIVFVAIYSGFLAATGKSTDEIVELMSTIADHGATDAIIVVMEGACSILGGFICARIARHSEYRLGAILGALLAAFLWIADTDEDTKGLLAATMIVNVLATMIGVWIGVRFNRRGR